jgi:hypothetical protein
MRVRIQNIRCALSAKRHLRSANADDEFTESQKSFLGLSFHGLMVHTKKPRGCDGVYTPLEKLVSGVCFRL